MWFPEIRFRNDAKPRESDNVRIYIFNDGTVVMREIFIATLMDRMDVELRAIPFDLQTCVMDIGSLS